VRVLETVTFVYRPREDRILAAINAGKPGAWSCWLPRRLVLVMLERAGELLASSSALAQRAPADVRGELIAFERDAAIANTAKAMSQTPSAVLKTSETTAELVERLTISSQGDNFRMELQGERGGVAAGLVARHDLQRILQMLQTEVAKADWCSPSAKSPASPSTGETRPKTARH
jgi:hypothetical protein